MTRLVNSWNEWAPLKRVILGSPVGTCNPKPDLSWDNTTKSYPDYFGPLSQEMQDAAMDEMNAFQNAMGKRGIKVGRPNVINTLQRTSPLTGNVSL